MHFLGLQEQQMLLGILQRGFQGIVTEISKKHGGVMDKLPTTEVYGDQFYAGLLFCC